VVLTKTKMKTMTVGSTKFSIDTDGNVTSADYPDLGNIEDCRAFAEFCHFLFDTLHS